MLRCKIDTLDDDTVTFSIDEGDDSLFATFGVFAVDNLDSITAENVPFALFRSFADLRFGLSACGQGRLEEFFHGFGSSGHVYSAICFVRTIRFLSRESLWIDLAFNLCKVHTVMNDKGV